VADGKRTERWLLTIDKGEVAVSRKNAAADSVVRADKALFERAVAGERNFFAAVLRGEVAIEGDAKLLVLLQRLFPRPSGRRRRRRPSATARRKK
jgi:putative sterol carrier protein